MTCLVYGDSVRGASHKRSNVVCQDCYKTVELDNGIILMAIADGHGSASCEYSDSGSQIAVNVFCKVMGDLLDNYRNNMDLLPTYLNREGDTKIAKAIDSEWKSRIWRAHLRHKREVDVDEDGEKNREAVYKKYGTTLIGLVITDAFVFALQIGDGDIVFVSDGTTEPLIEGDKILGVETHSLSRDKSWEKAISMMRIKDINDGKPYMYLLATDGFANSFKTQADFYETCEAYFSILKEHGIDAIKNNLKSWLDETSELGCGDDITVVLAYNE